MKILVSQGDYETTWNECFDIKPDFKDKFLSVLGSEYDLVAWGEFETTERVLDPIKYLTEQIRPVFPIEKAASDWDDYQKEKSTLTVSFTGFVDPRSWMTRDEYIQNYRREAGPIINRNQRIEDFIKEYND